jgi:hypothetical protein
VLSSTEVIQRVAPSTLQVEIPTAAAAHALQVEIRTMAAVANRRVGARGGGGTLSDACGGTSTHDALTGDGGGSNLKGGDGRSQVERIDAGGGRSDGDGVGVKDRRGFHDELGRPGAVDRGELG